MKIGASAFEGRALRRLLTGAAGAALIAMPGVAQAQSEEPETDEETIVVTGVTAPTTTSTGLALTFMETPQSVTVIDQKRIQDYALTGMKDLLDQVVGINVEDLETDRTSYNARGFDVTNFQIDGIGLPLIGNLTYGETDSFVFDRIDIVRGANGLTTGIGNPSATVNQIRKRPLADVHVNIAGYLGSWNRKRIEADVSTPIGDNWGVRAYMAHDQSNSYLEKYSYNRDVIGLVVSGKVTPELTFTAGYNRQHHDPRAASWIGLWLYYTDGTPINFRRSENSSPAWAKWPTSEDQVYGELAYAVGDWTIKGILTYRNYQDAPRILNPSGYPVRATGFYLGDTSEFETNNNRIMADLYASGTFDAFGQEHKLTAGVSYAHSDQKQYQGRAVDTGYGLGAVLLPNFNGPNRFNPALPTYNPKMLAQDQIDELIRGYVASQINFTDDLHLVAGASWAKVKSMGTSYGQVIATDESQFNPYGGLLFDITDNLTAYASYTTIFMPQTENDVNRQPLKPIKGTNMEAGLKANLFNKRFYATATVFRTEQKGLARFVGQVFDPVFGNFFYYEAVNKTKAEGFEFEVAGRVTPNWEVSGGFTTMRLRDQDDVDARKFIPRQTFKFATTYNVPELNKLSFGAQVRWQSDIDTSLTDQPAYAIVDLQAGIDIVENVRATVVVRNLTDKLYFTSLVYGDYGIGQYAAPRSFQASVSYRF
ncbi:TonB-dependent siderophore receptor [Sphingomonas sp. MG17]|uniref:TonB-dependent siderophore receptor n=1 Tax=Sphingomonas tagetis TaxID=2949092 RepID=A0A9X2HFG2_9SPHN|nr:TonB-dependent siderophore receptor [Sphingomonas tagetis]MCP3729878.1 TonB-dependent siderophore receptor [Sphingomonas tagetis]